MKVLGSARSVIQALHMVALQLTTSSLIGVSVPVRLEFSAMTVSGTLTVRPTNPDLYVLLEAATDAATPAVAIVSRVDVSITDEHVEAAVDDAVLLYGGQVLHPPSLCLSLYLQNAHKSHTHTHTHTHMLKQLATNSYILNSGHFIALHLNLFSGHFYHASTLHGFVFV